MKCLAAAAAKNAFASNVAGLSAACAILASAGAALGSASNGSATTGANAGSSSTYVTAVTAGDAFLAHVADVVEAVARKRGDPEAQTAQINDAVAAARAVTRAVTCTPGAVRAVLSRVPVYLLDGSSPDADGVGVRPGFVALFADFEFADSVGRFTRSFLATGSESAGSTSRPVKSADDEALELALMFTLAGGSSSNDVTAAVTAHLASIVERTAHPDESASARAVTLLAATFRVASSLASTPGSCDWLQRALRWALVERVIPNAMVTLVSSVMSIPEVSGSNPDAAASTCLECVARWRTAEARTRGSRISPPAWNLVATDLSNLAVSLSREPINEVGDPIDGVHVMTARLSSLAGVARGLAAVSSDAKSFDEIAAAVSGSIVNLEKVLQRLSTNITPKVTDPPKVADGAASILMDARAAGWTASAALLSVPRVVLSASASAATVRLLDDALEGLPAVSSAGDEPSRLLAGLRAIAALLERVVPAFPGEPEASLGVKVAASVERAVRSSRFRKNAPIWAAAVSCVLHPRLFGSSSRLHAAASDGAAGSSSAAGSSASVEGVGACGWFVRKAVAAGSKSGGARILRVVSHALAARLLRWPNHSEHYANEIWALGLCGEGGFTRAETLAMAEHWRGREAAATNEKYLTDGATDHDDIDRVKAGDDAGALADWLEDGGRGGAAGGHVAARVAALSLVHALALGEPPGGRGASGKEFPSGTEYRVGALEGAAALLRVGLDAVSGGDSDLARGTYRRGSITHRRKVRAWQMLCALAPALDRLRRVSTAGKVRRLLEKSHIFQSLSKNPGFVQKLGLGPELLPAANELNELNKSNEFNADDQLAFRSIETALKKAAPAAVAAHNLPGVRYYAEVFFTLAARSYPCVVTDVAIPALRSPDVKPLQAASWILVAAGRVVRDKKTEPTSYGSSGRGSKPPGPSHPVRGSSADRRDAEKNVELAKETLSAVAPWSLAHNHSLRVFAQLATHALLDAFGVDAFEADPSTGTTGKDAGQPSDPSDPCSSPGADSSSPSPAPAPAMSVLGSIASLLSTNSEMVKVRVACGPVFDAHLPCAPKDLLAGALDCESGPDDPGFEGAPASALASVDEFLRASREGLRRQRAAEDAWLWSDAMRAGCDLDIAWGGSGGGCDGGRVTGAVSLDDDDDAGGSVSHLVDGFSLTSLDAPETKAAGSNAGGTKGALSLQKKVEGAHGGSSMGSMGESMGESMGFKSADPMALALAAMANRVDRTGDPDASLGVTAADVDETLDKRPPERPPGLVVVASLVDKIPNLAGLARTCEVLGAEALVIADAARTVSHRDFTAVSVTAERWLPIRDVPVRGLVSYLRRLRREGYALVGLEQTRGAVDVNEYRFPRKTALVLGREREGIDADVLGVLDACVVIPQKGMIRSLNVHVSASVAMAAYNLARAH